MPVPLLDFSVHGGHSLFKPEVILIKAPVLRKMSTSDRSPRDRRRGHSCEGAWSTGPGPNRAAIPADRPSKGQGSQRLLGPTWQGARLGSVGGTVGSSWMLRTSRLGGVGKGCGDLRVIPGCAEHQGTFSCTSAASSNPDFSLGPSTAGVAP